MTIEDHGEMRTYTLPISPSDESYKKTFSNIILCRACDKKSIEQLQKGIIKYVDEIVSVQGKTYNKACNEIRTLIENIFSDFKPQIQFNRISEKNQLIFTNINNDEFGIEELSSGELEILSKLFPLCIKSMKEHIILIDEPEASLDPSWHFGYIATIRRIALMNDCQFILATHSPHILSSIYNTHICSQRQWMYSNKKLNLQG